MAVAKLARIGRDQTASAALYERIGTFLIDQRLEPEPGNYAFAHAILSDPDGPLARAVSALTDGGIRLTRDEVRMLGGDIVSSPKEVKKRADTLVARTQMQVESFDTTIHAIRADAIDFGRELAASADALARSQTTGVKLSEITEITDAMLDRVRRSEAQLEQATRESAELRGQLEEARDNARRDPLTDLPNRRAFEEAFEKLAAGATQLCVAVCDVDHFKSVNDRFGHIVGDRVLKVISGALAETCKDHFVGRYGGEEFVVLFNGVDIDSARQTLDRARLAVSSRHYKLRETDEPLGDITFSGGVTAVLESEPCGTAFHRADRMLYSAKNDGRNRIVAG